VCSENTSQNKAKELSKQYLIDGIQTRHVCVASINSRRMNNLKTKTKQKMGHISTELLCCRPPHWHFSEAAPSTWLSRCPCKTQTARTTK
jgi:hypothetical protein